MARLLSSGVDAHLAGDRKTADRCFAEANSPVVWQYTDAGWGAGCRVRHGFISIPDGPPYLAKDARPVPRMPTTATKKAVVERDGYHCRFCGIPVVDPAIRTLLNREYPDTVTWTNRNAGQHAAFQCMWLQYDHVLPNSRGGESSLENVVVMRRAAMVAMSPSRAGTQATISSQSSKRWAFRQRSLIWPRSKSCGRTSCKAARWASIATRPLGSTKLPASRLL